MDELIVLAAVFEVDPMHLLAGPGEKATSIAADLAEQVKCLAEDPGAPDAEAVQETWKQYRLLGIELGELVEAAETADRAVDAEEES